MKKKATNKCMQSQAKDQLKKLREVSRWISCVLAVLIVMLMVHTNRFVLQAAIVMITAVIFWGLLCMRRRLIKSDRAALAVFLTLLVLNAGYFSLGAVMLFSARCISYDVPQVSREIFSDRRVMIFVPHQDDEINLCGGIIEQYVESSEVYVVYSTNGDYTDGKKIYTDAETRVGEAIDALRVLGVERDHIILLGYGDTYGEGLIHMYNMPDDELYTSTAGFTHTYGASGIEAYSSNDYTHANLREDIKSVILDIQPDTIFCIDYDSHIDHRALSLFFEEAMGEILTENRGYTPAVYKGFAYSTAWYGEDDFYADNLLATVNSAAMSYMEENNIYNWSERIRFPVAAESLAWTRQASDLYTALECHASQGAQRQAGRVINSDKVFWRRDTDSLLYGAQCSASSGDPAYLTDFKLTDCSDINSDAEPFENLWQPADADADKQVRFFFDQPQTLSEIRVYDNPSIADNVLSVNITFSDGSSIRCDEIKANGSGTSITFEPKSGITDFCVSILDYDGVASFSEIEAYGVRGTTLPQFIKLMDQTGNFAYDYRTDETGRQTFTLYEYPAAEVPAIEGRYYLEASGGGKKAKAYISAAQVYVYCPIGRSMELRIYDSETDNLVEAVKISNPRTITRRWWSFIQRSEAEFDCSLVEYQKQYYGLWVDSLKRKLDALLG